jgi:hypothetical protein
MADHEHIFVTIETSEEQRTSHIFALLYGTILGE